jgi:hypothetical protein
LICGLNASLLEGLNHHLGEIGAAGLAGENLIQKSHGVLNLRERVREGTE